MMVSSCAFPYPLLIITIVTTIIVTMVDNNAVGVKELDPVSRKKHNLSNSVKFQLNILKIKKHFALTSISFEGIKTNEQRFGSKIWFNIGDAKTLVKLKEKWSTPYFISTKALILA